LERGVLGVVVGTGGICFRPVDLLAGHAVEGAESARVDKPCVCPPVYVEGRLFFPVFECMPMESSPSVSALESQFPSLVQDEALRAALRQQTQAATLSQDDFVCREGTMCSHLALVLDGRARVYKSGAEGRELTLYRVRPGESCILTTSCILSDRPFPAFARVEADLAARLVPAATVKQWMDRHAPWRTYVFDLLARRLDGVIASLEEVTFRRLDARLAATLLEGHAAAEDDTIRTTHEQLASDLGSAREVISRLLKHFERDGLVALARGAVTIEDREGLRRVGQGQHE